MFFQQGNFSKMGNRPFLSPGSILILDFGLPIAHVQGKTSCLEVLSGWKAHERLFQTQRREFVEKVDPKIFQTQRRKVRKERDKERKDTEK
jgi:hypothetical protein